MAALPELLTAILIFVIARFLTRLVSAFFERVEAETITVHWCHPDTAKATRRIVVGLCWVFAMIFAYPYLPGSESEAFRAVGVVVGLMVSLGSSGLVNQVMSGLVLIYSRALRPGEHVRVGDVEGTVTELGLLSTKVVTFSDQRFAPELALRIDLRRSGGAAADVALGQALYRLGEPTAVAATPFMTARYYYDVTLPAVPGLEARRAYTLLLRVLNREGLPVSEEQQLRFEWAKPGFGASPPGCRQPPTIATSDPRSSSG